MRRRSLPRLIVLAILVVTASTQPVFLLGAGFISISGELGFGPTGLGALTAAFFLTAATASAPLGRVVERIGWQRAMRINTVGSAAMLALIATTAGHPLTFGAYLVVAGAFYGLANPAANQALADHVDPRHRALVFGLKHAGIPASTLLAGLAVPLVVVTIGWRAAYGLALILPVLVGALVPRHPIVASPRSRADRRRRLEPLPTRLLARLGFGTAVATWAAIALSSYLVAAAVDAGFSEEQGGVLLFVGSLSSLLGRLVVGALTDRIGGRGFGGVALLTGIGAVVFVGLIPARGAWFVALVPIAFATGWGWPGLMTFSVVNANTGSAASSSAITQAGVFFGAGLSPIVLGWIVDTWSFSVAFGVVAAMLIVAAVTVMSVDRAAARRSRRDSAGHGR
jgi:MFS family permease